MASKKQKISQALSATYQDIKKNRLNQLTREVIYGPQKRTVTIMGERTNISDLRFKLANSLENTHSNKNAYANTDFDMMIASSIETLNSETNSEQEYFRWLDDCSEIIKDMNDGFVTKDDLDSRNNFLEMSHQREADLMLCLELYAGSSHPKAAEKAARLRYKLQKLREMRQVIEAQTKNEADVKISKQEYEMALPYYKLFKSLARLPYGEDLPAERRALGINHETDFDLSPSYDYYAALVNESLDEEDAEATFESRHQEISDKLKDLAGRRQTFKLSYVILENKKAQLQNN